jgi:hypothetical protein
MRRVVPGLVLLLLLPCGNVSAGELQLSTESDPSQKVYKPPSPDHRRLPKKSQPRSASPALPLSSAETYAAEQRGNIPVSSSPKPSEVRSPGPANNSWTGFYVGAGAGAGRD